MPCLQIRRRRSPTDSPLRFLQENKCIHTWPISHSACACASVLSISMSCAAQLAILTVLLLENFAVLLAKVASREGGGGG